jgi:drug/metabolite transporter (DMT)-like permease
MSDNRPARGALYALLSALMFGFAGAVAGGVFDVVPPVRVAQARSLMVVVLLVPFALIRGSFRPQPGLWRIALMGLNLALVTVTFYWAIDLLGVGPGATVQFLGPIMVLAWFAIVRRERVQPLVWFAAIGAVFGVGMVTRAWTLDGGDVVGIAAGLAAAVAFASYLIYGEHLAEAYRPLYITTWGFIFSSLIWLVVLPIWTFPTDIGGAAWRDLVVIAVVGTALPFVLEFRALALVSSSIVGVMATAEPAIGAAFASVMLDQRLEPIQWVGVAFVVASVAAVQRWGLRAASPPVPIIP